jgi:hypothetical protein
MVREHGRFQLEATKLGRTVVFQVTVYERADKARARLSAETQCTDPQHFIVQFIVRDAPDFESLLRKFQEELEFRGFAAVRYRRRDADRWGDWAELAAGAPEVASRGS